MYHAANIAALSLRPSSSFAHTNFVALQGTDGECPPGTRCFAEVDCPLPPTISPKPTRSPVPGFELGNHDKQVIGAFNVQLVCSRVVTVCNCLILVHIFCSLFHNTFSGYYGELHLHTLFLIPCF